MAFSDRSYSIGTCERELEKIHRTLKGISQTIDEKIVESDMKPVDKSSENVRSDGKQQSDDLHRMLTCDDTEFEQRINEMKIVDLELAVIIFEQQIKIENEIKGKQSNIEKSNVYQLRDRLTRCFLKKSLLIKGTQKVSNVDDGFKLKEGNVEMSKHTTAETNTNMNADSENLGSLNIEELRVLLTYNGLDFDGNSNRATLEAMVRKHLLQEEEGEDDDWEPPLGDSMNWKTPALESTADKPSISDSVETSKVSKESIEFDELDNKRLPIDGPEDQMEEHELTKVKDESLELPENAQITEEPKTATSVFRDNGVEDQMEEHELIEVKDESLESSENAKITEEPKIATTVFHDNGLEDQMDEHKLTTKVKDESLESSENAQITEEPKIATPVFHGDGLEANAPTNAESTMPIAGQSKPDQDGDELIADFKSITDSNIEKPSTAGEEVEEITVTGSPDSIPKTAADTPGIGDLREPIVTGCPDAKSNLTEQNSCSQEQQKVAGNPDSKLLLTTQMSRDKDAGKNVANFEDDAVVNWNPISLLKYLHQDIAKPEEIQFKKPDEKKKSDIESKQKCKMDGYLEKLPVNQSKASVFKGWKKRYFKITQGKLFYFEDHLSTVPLGNILLTGSEVKVPGDRLIQIRAQNNGDFISIRCLSSTECNDWYRAIKREAVISTPVSVPVQLPLQQDMPKSSIIIIDLGASSIKGGHAGEDKPRVVFPAVYAVRKERKDGRKFTESGIPDPTLCRCGYEALEPETRQTSKLVFPLRPSLKVDKYAIKARYLPGFVEKVFKELKVEPHDSTVILSHQRNFGIKEKEILLDYLFGQLGVKAVCSQEQGLLSLYSYKDTTGIVVDIGDHIDVIPVLEGTIIENGTSSLPQGGQLVTEYLSRILSEGGYRFFSEVESFIVRFVKEQSSFVSLDYEKEMESTQNKFVVDMSKYNLPGNKRSVTIDDGRFRCTEGLFDPNKWGKDHEGVHKLVEKAIKQTGIDFRKEMCRKIYLSGGTTLIEGFAERLQKELKFLMPETINIQVHAAKNRVNAAFLGATIIAEQPSFSELLISKENWHKHGVNVLNQCL